MKAIVCERFGHWRDLRIKDVPVPELAPDAVRIRVHYSTLGFGQTLVVGGRYQRKPPLPFVPGIEASGVVEAIGPRVRTLAAGDRVVAAMGWGAYAQEAVVPAHSVWRIPHKVSLAAAAGLPMGYATVYAALHWRARLRPGETLLVLGAAGGVGLAAVALGKLAGARVIAVAGSPERVATALSHGADAGVVHGGEDFVDAVLAHNAGRKVDVVFDPVGGALFAQALRCTAPEGRMLLIGFASGDVPQIPANHLLVKNVDVMGFYFGEYVGWGGQALPHRYREKLPSMMARLLDHTARGELRPVTESVYAMQDFAQAFEAVEQRRSVGRVLLRFSEGADA